MPKLCINCAMYLHSYSAHISIYAWHYPLYPIRQACDCFLFTIQWVIIRSWVRYSDIFSSYCCDCGMLDQVIHYSCDANILNSCLLDDPRLSHLAYTPVDLYAIGAGPPSTRPLPCSSVISSNLFHRRNH